MDDDRDMILYLSSQEVEQICEDIDSVEIMRKVFAAHAEGQIILPDEAYLGWTTKEGEIVRSLNMPAYIGSLFDIAGTKIINGNIANSQRGLPRASGLTILYDPVSVRPCCIMEAAYLSSLRTASVTALAVELLQGKSIECAAIIGAGTLAHMHINLLLKRFTHIETILLFDSNESRAIKLQQMLAPQLQARHIALHIVPSAEAAIRPAQLIVPVTTTTTGYIRFCWLQPGAIIVNVSLDDVLPEVVFQADLLVVDDWKLVKSDTRRLIGRMYHAGNIIGPEDTDESTKNKRRKIDAQLGELVIGNKVGRRTQEERILVNPFGLAAEDVMLAMHVYQKAREQNIGVFLKR